MPFHLAEGPMATQTTKVELSPKELELLVESLTHCLETCQNGGLAGHRCTDCERAEKVKAKLERALAA
jgi:hypothetical protein